MTSSLALGSLPWDRERARGIALRLLSVAIAALLVSAGTAAVAAIGARRHVIVRTLPGFERAVEREITHLGGQVGIELPIVNGFVATIPDSSLPALSIGLHHPRARNFHAIVLHLPTLRPSVERQQMGRRLASFGPRPGRRWGTGLADGAIGQGEALRLIRKG